VLRHSIVLYRRKHCRFQNDRSTHNTKNDQDQTTFVGRFIAARVDIKMSNNSNDDDDATSKHRNDEKENGKNDSDLASSGTEESFVTAKSNESSDDVSVTDTDSKKTES
jgi:hypothetical protein